VIALFFPQQLVARNANAIGSVTPLKLTPPAQALLPQAGCLQCQFAGYVALLLVQQKVNNAVISFSKFWA